MKIFAYLSFALALVGYVATPLPAVAQSYTVLYNFGDSAGGIPNGNVTNPGAVPVANLMQAKDGNFYGTAYEGGFISFSQPFGGGNIFKMNSAGQVTILHSFGDGTVPGDGVFPYSALIQATDGNWYGTTVGGTTGTNSGTIFKLTAAGTVSIIHTFGLVAGDGVAPYAALVQGTDGNLYGTTANGGNTSGSYGTIFKISTTGVYTVLHSFGDGSVVGDGTSPISALIQGSDGNFYGTTRYGGSTATGGNIGNGTAFMMTPTGQVTVLHSFGDGSAIKPDGTPANDGVNPYASLTRATDGNFYGTTPYGLPATLGTVFKLAVTGGKGTVTILHSFSGTAYDPNGVVTPDGVNPDASLVQAKDGNLYGTTIVGGADGISGVGTVFRMTLSGSVTLVHHFDDGTVPLDGVNPYANVIQGIDGQLYGTTTDGGSGTPNVDGLRGTIFRLGTAGLISQNITFPSIPSHVISDPPFQLAATATSGQAVTYAVISGPATVSGNTVTLTGSVGTVVIQASQIGGFVGVTNGSVCYAQASTVRQTFSVGSGKLSQTISPFGVLPTIYYRATPADLTPYLPQLPTASSGLPVKFTIKSGPASLSGNFITTLGVGTVVVAADQAGNASYQPAPEVTTSFVVQPGFQRITFPAVGSASVGQQVTLTATATSGLPVTYRVIPTAGYTGTATVLGNVVTFTGAGNVLLAASQAGSSLYQAAPQATQTVSVH